MNLISSATSSSSMELITKSSDVSLEIVRCIATLISALCACYSIYLTIQLKRKDQEFSAYLHDEQRFSKAVIDYSVDTLEIFRKTFLQMILKGNENLSKAKGDQSKFQSLIRTEMSAMQAEFYKIKTAISYRVKVYKDVDKSFDSAQIWERCDNLLSNELFSAQSMAFCEKKTSLFFEEIELIISTLKNYSKTVPNKR